MGWPLSFQLAAIVLCLLGACFVKAVLMVLGHSLRTQIRKHDIIAEARRRRQAYLDAVAQRAARVSGVDPEDLDPSQFNVDIVEEQQHEAHDASRRAAA